jgi:hypothetical protein
MFEYRSRAIPPHNDDEATANGDAVWLVRPIEYTPTPPEKSFTQLVPRDTQLTLVERALASFKKPS